MKKLLCLLLIVVMTVSMLAGCGTQTSSIEKNENESKIQGTGLGMAISKNIIDMMGGTIEVHTEQGKGTEFIIHNELNREIALEILGEYAFRIDTAENGAEAVEKASASKPGEYDLVLMDIQMPVMDGYEASRRIRMLNQPT